MRQRAGMFLWSVIFSLPFLFMELSILLSPFELFPTWLLYLLSLILGLAIVEAIGNFKAGTFVTFIGAVIATVAYFWIGKIVLQVFGFMSSLMATNLTSSSIVLTASSLYLLSVLGNLIALFTLGFK